MNQSSEIEEESLDSFAVPDWQVKLGKEELQKIADGTTEISDLSDLKRQLQLGIGM